MRQDGGGAFTQDPAFWKTVHDTGKLRRSGRLQRVPLIILHGDQGSRFLALWYRQGWSVSSKPRSCMCASGGPWVLPGAVHGPGFPCGIAFHRLPARTVNTGSHGAHQRDMPLACVGSCVSPAVNAVVCEPHNVLVPDRAATKFTVNFSTHNRPHNR